ncbi:hypothetical protein PV328_012201 [Microctonus aethiopoides]|uniref:Uncharacterized protein n=1 Tax=Microctonus aethiopoides TaxID=144406 RepID=A0AA39FHB0_9HYME|nr:hypothetical protein PV328_012201 [Microctonus aethiopoides]
MANRNLKEREDILKQIVKTSDIIRQKHKMIKLARDKTEQAMKEVFKPVVTPLEKLVTTSNQMKREIKDEPTDIIPKEEIDQTYATAMSENDYDEVDHTFNNSELNKTINQFESDDIPFEISPLKQHESNSSIEFKDNMIYVANEQYPGTPGLSCYSPKHQMNHL